MSKDSTLFHGLGTHNSKITVAYIGEDRQCTVQDFGSIATQRRSALRCLLHAP
ncbi:MULTISPECIES: hypothetical protein [unclassified Endozoicomonas]|uniref:hypothetical protein n=1 Tax=unclassified Endozoicomonas TaxID=2644528 RepID=UPI00214934EF|nr:MULTISPECIES: hypothetical protein [unclassified Endozoicomonas]